MSEIYIKKENKKIMQEEIKEIYKGDKDKLNHMREIAKRFKEILKIMDR